MRHTRKLFKIGLRQIQKDGMLLIMIPAPFLAGIFFRFAIPVLNQILVSKFSFSITPWYGLIDGMLICLAPMFVAMISAFTLLEERDEGVSAFYQITPAAGYSYLTARIALPMVWAFLVTIIVTVIFHLSDLSFAVIFLSAVISSFTGIFLAMMVVSIAGNRVEGLAVSKMMGISFIGLILIWFMPAPSYYIIAFLPSFWIGKVLMDGADSVSFLFGLITCFLWIAIFTRRFLKRL
ncbi:hypothetical protein HGO97_009140 [Faecalicatena sp. AGMB00832]|uniref:Fluoroquinolone transport system permease protein n=2 Tax=Faecalicatena faecalis TaxID=2726362 RepID=A0ABS6D3B4_9FIRM|nr:hypothetical protein [Faecalicatena faecalis]